MNCAGARTGRANKGQNRKTFLKNRAIDFILNRYHPGALTSRQEFEAVDCTA